MRPLVAEAGLAAMVVPGSRPLVVAARRRRRGRWLPLSGDAALAAIDAAGPSGVVLARPPAADPGAACLPALARLLGVPVVRLPGDAARAAWTVAVAGHPRLGDEGLVRGLEAIAAAARGDGALPRRSVGEDIVVPAVRPATLARWARCAWRPCGRCGGGGVAGGVCPRCGSDRLGAS